MRLGFVVVLYRLTRLAKRSIEGLRLQAQTIHREDLKLHVEFVN